MLIRQACAPHNREVWRAPPPSLVIAVAAACYNALSMSSSAGLVPYLVPLDELRAFVGSKDLARAQKIEGLFKSEIAENSSIHRQAIVDGAPTLAQAVAKIAAGEPLRGFGAQYVYALELLCAHFGQKLRNGTVYPVDDEWLMRVVDPIFDAWKLGEWLSFKRLVYGAWPIKLPHAEFPRGGMLEADDIERALAVMRGGALPRFDKEVVMLIGEVRGWLEAATARHAGIVAFYY
jgi:hypothetical protein